MVISVRHCIPKWALVTAALGFVSVAGMVSIAEASAAGASVARGSAERSNSGVIGEYVASGFAPIKGETFVIPLLLESVSLADIKKAVVELYTEDGDLVRTITARQFNAGAPAAITWDGKDEKGMIVPDETYLPKVTLTMKNGNTLVEDTAEGAWGEEVYDFDKTIRNGVIEYQLPDNARVLVRAGIKNGPMLRTVVDWAPRGRGFHAERWDGMDSDKLESIEMLPGIAYLIIGYRLPAKAIITWGNDRYDYKAYRIQKGWPLAKKPYGEKVLERDGKPVRHEYYLPIAQLKSPKLQVLNKKLKDEKDTSEFNRFDEIISAVNIAKEDEFYLDQSRYEISFFVDYEFVAEEEQGYVPFRWRWSPGRRGVEPGEHILTVNISSYNGQVTVKNMRFSLLDN